MWRWRFRHWSFSRGATPCLFAHAKLTLQWQSIAGPTLNTATLCTSTTDHTVCDCWTWPKTWESAAQPRTPLVEENPSPRRLIYNVIISFMLLCCCNVFLDTKHFQEQKDCFLRTRCWIFVVLGCSSSYCVWLGFAQMTPALHWDITYCTSGTLPECLTGIHWNPKRSPSFRKCLWSS